MGSNFVTGAEAPRKARDDGLRAIPTPPNAVLDLQQSAGNAAVGRLLRQSDATVDFEVESRSGAVLLQGEQLVVRAKVRGLRDPSSSVTPGFVHLGPQALPPEEQGWEGSTYVWKFRFNANGAFPLEFLLGWGREHKRTVKRFKQTIMVVTDAREALDVPRKDNADRLKWIEKLYTDARIKLNQASDAFNDAFLKHQKELQSVSADENVDKSLWLTVLIFGFGSTPPYPVATMLRPHMNWANTYIDEALIATLAGAAGGVAVAPVRELADRARGGSRTSMAGSGVVADILRYAFAEDPDSAPQGSDRDPAYVNPLRFYLRLDTALAMEKSRALGSLEKDKRAYEDPLALAFRYKEAVDTFTARLVTSSRRYHEWLWGAWMHRYYYTIVPQPGAFTPHKLWGVQTPGWRITRKLDELAEKFHYSDLQAFAARYADKSKLAEVARRNNEPYPPEPLSSTDDFFGDNRIRDWLRDHSRADIAALPEAKKVHLIRRLLRGSVSDDDVDAVETLCRAVTDRAEMERIAAAIRPLLDGFTWRQNLWREKQRMRLFGILDIRP